MNIEELYEYCLSKTGASEHLPFGNDILVFKILEDKLFCISSLTSWENGKPFINLKCQPDKALQLRLQYSSINAGYHMNKKHWNSISINGDVSDELVKKLIDHSYELVAKGLSKSQQEILAHLSIS